MAALGRTYYFCMGFRVVVKGKQVSSAEAPILAVAPHSTFFDGIVCIVAGLPSTVSRAENLATPIFGRESRFLPLSFIGCQCVTCCDVYLMFCASSSSGFVRCLQPVLVSRQDPDSRKNTILEIESRAKSEGCWPQVCLTHKQDVI